MVSVTDGNFVVVVVVFLLPFDLYISYCCCCLGSFPFLLLFFYEILFSPDCCLVFVVCYIRSLVEMKKCLVWTLLLQIYIIGKYILLLQIGPSNEFFFLNVREKYSFIRVTIKTVQKKAIL